MVDKDIKGCSTPLVWREIHRPLYTHKTAKIKKTTQVLNEDIEQRQPYAEYMHPVLCLVSTVSDSLDPVDCSPPGSVHGDSLGRNTRVGCHPSSRGSSQPRDRTHVSTLQADSLPTEPPTDKLRKRKSEALEVLHIPQWFPASSMGPICAKAPSTRVCKPVCQVLLYFKWITNKVLLYNIGNSA